MLSLSSSIETKMLHHFTGLLHARNTFYKNNRYTTLNMHRRSLSYETLQYQHQSYILSFTKLLCFLFPVPFTPLRHHAPLAVSPTSNHQGTLRRNPRIRIQRLYPQTRMPPCSRRLRIRTPLRSPARMHPTSRPRNGYCMPS